MNAIKIRDGIYWVGAIDWSMRSFHGYDTQRGSTYNAYLIIDDKITLIDTDRLHRLKPRRTGSLVRRPAHLLPRTECEGHHERAERAQGTARLLRRNAL